MGNRELQEVLVQLESPEETVILVVMVTLVEQVIRETEAHQEIQELLASLAVREKGESGQLFLEHRARQVSLGEDILEGLGRGVNREHQEPQGLQDFQVISWS